MVSLWLLLLLPIWYKITNAALSPCKPAQAAEEGDFSCFNDCDANTYYDGQHYCLTYLPDNQQCYLETFKREKMLTCNDRLGTGDPNLWIIMIGGSNQFSMLKTLADILLETPSGTLFNVQSQWNASATVPSDHELALMDFVWDAEHQSVRRTAWDWDPSCYYCMPNEMVDIFLDVPTPAPKGSFRISYANLHYANELINRFDQIVSSGSPWLATNPDIHIYFEWSGRWGDWDVGSDVHLSNLQHFVNRQQNEGLNIRTYLTTDSAFGCEGTSGTKDNVIIAYNSIDTTFPKYYFSKSQVALQQQELSGICMTNGHALRPLDYVAINRYFNIICPNKITDEDEIPFQAEIPVCINVVEDEEYCFYFDGYWMSNLFYTCDAQYSSAGNYLPGQYCPAPDYDKNLDIYPELPTCTSTNSDSAVDGISSDSDSSDNDDSHRNGSIALSVIAYIGGFCCFVFLMYESWQIHMKQLEKQRSKAHAQSEGDVTSKPLPHRTKEVVVTPRVVVCDDQVDIEMTSQGSLEKKMDDEAAKEVDTEEAKRAEEREENDLMVQSMTGGIDIKPDEVNQHIDVYDENNSNNNNSMWALVMTYFYYPLPADNNQDRFEAINFARFLAGIHIVLGHMYQGGSLNSFDSFNKFGYTWVPWFFMLSGYILTTSEARRRKKLAKISPTTNDDAMIKPKEQEDFEEKEDQKDKKAIEQVNKPKQDPLMDYILRRLETLYPTYLAGIFISIITVWAIKGADALPPPTNVLLSFVLLQSWIPSILEYGLVYLVQCWFISCMLFYWCLFHHVFDFLQQISTIKTAHYVALVAFICSVVLPLIYQLAIIPDYEWTDEHTYLGTDEGYDVATVTLKYHPMAYLHIFVLGCTLPYIRSSIVEIMKDTDHRYHAIMRNFVVPFMTLASYTILVILYCTAADDIPGYKLSLRLGLISILQATILVGLCIGEDYLARLFNHPFFVVFGQYSFPQYVFQFIVQAWYTFACGKNIVDFRYFMLLFTTSVVIWTSIKRFNGKNMTFFVKCLLPWLALYLILQPFLANYTRSSDDDSSISFPSWWKDSILNTKVVNTEPSKGYQDSKYVFNPNIFIDDEELFSVLVARRDTVLTQGYSWYHDSDYMQQMYITDIVIGTFSQAKMKQLQSLNKISRKNFKPCVPPFTCNSNGTLTAKITSAPEDPRIIKLNGEFYATFFSYDNIITDPINPTDDDLSMLADTYKGDFDTGSHICVSDGHGLIGRMYITKIFQVPANPCSMHEIMPIHVGDMIFPNNSVVKNWLAFAYPPKDLLFYSNVSKQSLYFIHQVYPNFVVTRADQNNDGSYTALVVSNTTAPAAVNRLATAALRRVGKKSMSSASLTKMSSGKAKLLKDKMQQSTLMKPSPVKNITIRSNISTSAIVDTPRRRLMEVPTSSPTAFPTSRPTSVPTARPTARPTATPTIKYNPCIDGYMNSPTGRCYKLNNFDIANYFDASTSCQAIGGWLATIHNKADNDFLRDMGAIQSIPNFFIGFNAIDEEGVYTWKQSANSSNNFEATNFTFWNYDHSHDSGDDNCVVMLPFNAGKWKDINCGWAVAYACETHGFDVVSQPTIQPTAASDICPAGYKVSPDYHCFRISDYLGDFWNAVEGCETDYHGWLATIRSGLDNDFIQGLVNDEFEYSVYIGYNDLEDEGNFTWIAQTLYKQDIRSTYTNWAANEPSNYNGNENCVEFYYFGEWNDNYCYDQKRFVCEAPSSYVAPTKILEDNMENNPIHGNVNPLYISGETSPYLQQGYFLSVFHLKTKPTDSMHYTSYAFAFCPQLPFKIAAVSSEKLLLHTTLTPVYQNALNSSCTNDLAFVSGLTLDRCYWDKSTPCLVLSYGVCDRESRVAYVSLYDYEKQYLRDMQPC